jgi:urate oxidase
VLKSTGSAFHGFHRDEYAKLPETWDRILSTEVECVWTWRTFPNKEAVDAAADKFDGAFEKVKRITLDMFAKDNSASVQNTMYKMAELILEAVPEIEKVEYLLPNRHYFEIGELPPPYIVGRIDSCRSQLAQGAQEHGQGRGGICTSDRP